MSAWTPATLGARDKTVALFNAPASAGAGKAAEAATVRQALDVDLATLTRRRRGRPPLAPGRRRHRAPCGVERPRTSGARHQRTSIASAAITCRGVGADIFLNKDGLLVDDLIIDDIGAAVAKG